MEEKLTDLEMKYSFHEDLLLCLNETVVKQQQAIEKLTIEVKHLHEQLLDLREIQTGPAELAGEQEKPPHY
ncbi:MAG: SlyX family protein [Gammaproteobacteria bacterium]|nr:SlyX family protein [Gammaproteobacteria bacterium]